MTTTDDIMLDEYGNPIGQLAVQLGTRPASLAVVDTSIETAQDAALEDNALELPAIAPNEIAEYYPKYDDDTLRNRAKRLMIVEGKSVSDIANAIGVPERTILMWIANFKWADTRRRELIAQDEISRMELARVRIEKRNEVFKSQLEQARKIRDKAVKGIDDKTVPVKAGAEAWAAAAKAEQTILGLSEAGHVASADGKDAAESKKSSGSKDKQPLVMVFQGGGLPPVRRPGV